MKGFDIMMMDKPPIVNESKITDEVKKTNGSDKTNQTETTNNEGGHKFSDLSFELFGIKYNVRKSIHDDEADLYVTVKNTTADFVDISINLQDYEKYIKGKNLVFDRCLYDFETIKEDTDELEIYLYPDEKQQFSIHYKKPSEKVDFKELLEKKREGCVVTSEKTEQDEKNKNIEIASVEITNNGKFPFCVSKMKDYFRKKKPEKNYKFLKYTIEDIANDKVTKPDEIIPEENDENADILIKPNTKVRICAIYSKLENKGTEKTQNEHINLENILKKVSYNDFSEIAQVREKEIEENSEEETEEVKELKKQLDIPLKKMMEAKEEEERKKIEAEIIKQVYGYFKELEEELTQEELREQVEIYVRYLEKEKEDKEKEEKLKEQVCVCFEKLEAEKGKGTVTKQMIKGLLKVELEYLRLVNEKIHNATLLVTMNFLINELDELYNSITQEEQKQEKGDKI